MILAGILILLTYSIFVGIGAAWNRLGGNLFKTIGLITKHTVRITSIGGVGYVTGLMTVESYFVNPLGITIWFGFITLLAAFFLLIAIAGIKHDCATQKRVKLKAQADKERFYMSDFQARRGEWADDQ